MTWPRRLSIIAVGAALSLATCRPATGCRGDYCGTLIFAMTGEPDILLPPVSQQVQSRDIADQLFLKLADMRMSANTVGEADFEPLLAQRWTWDDSLTLVFHLRPEARWQDGTPVTAADVAFTFDAYTDAAVNSPFRSVLGRIAGVTARDPRTAVFRFKDRYPEMFYDAAAQMRILPAHLLRDVPRAQWATAPFGRAPVGDGPYRFASWVPGTSIELVADSTFFLGRPHIRRLIFHFMADLATAVTQVVGGEADAIEILVTPDNLARARAAPQLATYSYEGVFYGYLGLNQRANGDPARPHPIFGDRDVRRALAMAVDRERMRQSVLGDMAKVPPGPMPTLWPLWNPPPRTLPHDSAAAASLLTVRGWVDRNGDGFRERGNTALAFRILLPATSGIRKQYGRLLQEQFRAIGARVELDEVEGPVFGQRTQAGRFDAYLGAWSTDVSPSGLAEQWSRSAFGGSNHVRYDDPEFDRLVDEARRSRGSPDEVRALWRRAIEVFNDDAPAIVLFATENVAAVHARVAEVRIRGDSYWALVRTWRIPADKLIERDRALPSLEAERR
jgi:peptide/nickel transport system substrate-binding protein